MSNTPRTSFHPEGESEPTPALGARIRRALAASPWTSLAGKLAVYAIGLLLLALLGSGRFLRWTTPARAETQASPAASATTSASARPGASPSASSAAPAESAAPRPAVTEDGKVALNRATETDLRRLPGVGATKAKAILELRAKLGGFKKPEDLLRIKGLGRKSLNRLKPLIVID